MAPEKFDLDIIRFLDVLWYNGHEEAIAALVKELLFLSEGHRGIPGDHIVYPEKLAKLYGWDDSDHQVHIFWSYLVMKFGNYGTSPRYGWLSIHNLRVYQQDTLKSMVEWLRQLKDSE